MKVVSVVCLLLAFTVVALAQQKFTADFEFRQPSMRGGVVYGKVEYDWSARGLRFYYTTSKLAEIYKFNNERGRDLTKALSVRFLGQWLYRNSDGCDCQTSSVSVAMPQLFRDTTNSDYEATGASQMINGQSCLEYKTKAGIRTDVTEIYFNGNTICGVVFKGGRDYKFTNLNTNPTIPAASFATPEGCKCGKPVDISIVLDRSSSISYTEFLREKNFTVGFARSFRYGPLEANLALVHFMKEAWTTLTLVEGTNEAYVNDSLSTALTCSRVPCGDYFDTSKNRCCCCGTSISSGTIEGANQLVTGRPGVEKVLIVLTDGFHNHNRSHLPCSGGGDRCIDDLQFAVNYAYEKIPSVTSFAVGVGPDDTLSQAELLMLARDVPERVLRYNDFDSLANGFLDVVGLACQVEETPCGDCCGFCACGGKCIAPDACDQNQPCHENEVSGMCCKQTPTVCEAPNKCSYASCDIKTQECVVSNVTCPPSTPCLDWQCNHETGRCASTPAAGADPVDCNGAECIPTKLELCFDDDLCTIDQCEDEKCTWAPVDCNDGNACTIDTCDPKVGCVHTNLTADACDDQNACTADSCSPATGCVNTDIVCPDDENGCTVEECDILHGCRSTILNCSAPVDEEERKARGESVKPDGYCRFYACNTTTGVCGYRDQDCTAPVGLSVGATVGLTVGAIAGIVIAVVVAVVLLGGGGAFAYSKAMAGGNNAVLMNNPLYAGKGASGVNPLHRG